MSQANPSGLTENPGLSDNAAGAIAYITIVPAIIFLMLDPFKTRPYVRFHAWQSIALFVAACVIDFALGLVLAFTVGFIPFMHFALARIVDLFWLVVFIVCVISAAQGKRLKLPVVGDLAEQQANK